MSIAERLIATIRQEITSGVLVPGIRLTEAKIAQRHNVSRTPARTALRALEKEGLVVLERNKGAIVSQWTTAHAAEVMRLRALLEPHAVALGAEARTEGQLRTLGTLCHQMEEAHAHQGQDYRSELSQLNRAVHLKFLETAHSPRTYAITSELITAPLMLSSFHIYSAENICRSLQDHREILDALISADAPRAQAQMEAHMRNAYATLLNRETSQNPTS